MAAKIKNSVYFPKKAKLPENCLYLFWGISGEEEMKIHI
ncbi:hypothetical protein B6N60_05070 [Richelia sinica FACHB-800]|uniref:Uncharacterized protein n=1 Tax=Richelia sinica FACHB-800 TaxID=1357546 RepID=A0A975Y7H8_9NOST|nr:hypothetical protein B6N60_05070 [Richelia sinica FACHB-800]